MKPQRIQLKRTKGWRMPPNTVKVTRPGKWGNPFYISRWRDAKSCVALFHDAVHGIWNPLTSAHLPKAWNGYNDYQSWLKKAGHNFKHDVIHELRGKNLACWCAIWDEKGLRIPCHADLLLEIANA